MARPVDPRTANPEDKATVERAAKLASALSEQLHGENAEDIIHALVLLAGRVIVSATSDPIHFADEFAEAVRSQVLDAITPEGEGSKQ